MSERGDVGWSNCPTSRSVSICASRKARWPNSSEDRVGLDFGRHVRMIAEGIAEPRRTSGERNSPLIRRRYQNGSLVVRGKRKKVWVARWREPVLAADGTLRSVRRSEVIGTLAD